MKIFIEKTLLALLKVVSWSRLIDMILIVAGKIALITKNVYDDIAVKLIRGGIKITDSAKSGEETRFIIADSCELVADSLEVLAKKSKTKLDDAILQLLSASADLIRLQDDDDPKESLILVLNSVETAFSSYVKATDTPIDDYILLALSALADALAEENKGIIV